MEMLPRNRGTEISHPRTEEMALHGGLGTGDGPDPGRCPVPPRRLLSEVARAQGGSRSTVKWRVEGAGVAQNHATANAHEDIGWKGSRGTADRSVNPGGRASS